MVNPRICPRSNIRHAIGSSRKSSINCRADPYAAVAAVRDIGKAWLITPSRTTVGRPYIFSAATDKEKICR
jgi:hypothetical protein